MSSRRWTDYDRARHVQVVRFDWIDPGDLSEHIVKCSIHGGGADAEVRVLSVWSYETNGEEPAMVRRLEQEHAEIIQRLAIRQAISDAREED